MKPLADGELQNLSHISNPARDLHSVQIFEQGNRVLASDADQVLEMTDIDLSRL